MFSPFPNKQRGQAFSPASSASSPVPTAALAGSFSRQGHPFTPTQNNQGPVTDTRTPVSSAPQVPSAAKPGSKPPKALPLFDPKLRPNIAHWPIPETTSTRPGWAIRWRRYTYAALHTASTASPPDLSHSLQSPVHDVQDAHRPHKRQKTDLQPGDVDAYRFSSPAIWLAACASQSPDGLDAIERARKRVQETIAHIQDAHLGFHQPDAPIVHPPPAIPSSDIEDGEVGELAPSSSSTSTYPSPLVTLNPHSDPPGPATHPGMPARTCFVHTIPSESAVQRHLWIFDLDERACSMSPLPDHFEGLESQSLCLKCYALAHPCQQLSTAEFSLWETCIPPW